MDALCWDISTIFLSLFIVTKVGSLQFDELEWASRYE